MSPRGSGPGTASSAAATPLSLFPDILLVLAIAAVLFMFFKNQYFGEVEYVRSRVDGRKYLVRKLGDSREAADRLATIAAKLTALVQHVMAKDGPQNADARRLYKNFDPDNISEGGMEHGYTSYSVNKGEKIVLCIRQTDNSFVDENVIVYVAVHELAHLMTAEVGHTASFWAHFQYLIGQAVDIGIYRAVDFDARPQPYCGIEITSSVI